MAKITIDDIPVTNLEMETAALYGLSQLMGHSAVSLSVVLANRITGQFVDSVDRVVEQMIQKALIEITENL